MKKSTGIIVLLLVALVFGFAFAFQSISADYIGPFLLNGSRFIIGFLITLPAFLLKKDDNNKTLFIVSSINGFIIFLATNIQQYAIGFTSAGKAGFLTALYIVLVPLIASLFLKKKIGINDRIAVVLALIGLILLCNLTLDDFILEFYDFCLIITALLFAMQILLVEQFVDRINPIKSACITFFVAGTLSLICSLLFETFDLNIYKQAIPSILYLGFLSTGLGYSLQIVGQKVIASNDASLIMSLESVFSVIGGYIILHEVLTIKELIGCLIMFIAVILSQLPEKKKL